MKTKAQKSITLEAITDQLDKFDLKTARLSLTETIGASLRITGEVIKVAKRQDVFRLVVSANSDSRKMTAFANFDDEAEKLKVTKMKIRKGSNISITGKFESFGSDALCLDNCKLSK